MKTKVQILREAKNLTQAELAEKSGLSLRTVQRMEAGNIPKGFTLRALADSLDTHARNLVADMDKEDFIKRAKYINISTLFSLFLPFGNLIFPTILTLRSSDEKAKTIGKELVTLQIIYTFILGILLIACPFIQKAFSIRFPLFVPVLVTMKCLNMLMILKNGAGLNRNKRLSIKLKTSIL